MFSVALCLALSLRSVSMARPKAASSARISVVAGRAGFILSTKP